MLIPFQFQMLCGSKFDQIILKSPDMNQHFGLQLDGRNRFPFCNPPKNVGFQLKCSIVSIWYSTHSSFLPPILSYKLGDARILNFPHFVAHLKKEQDGKESGLPLRYFHGGNKKPKPMLFLCPNALSMPLFHFAIKGEKFHDSDFLSLNEFLK